jgi:hypothetical protein
MQNKLRAAYSRGLPIAEKIPRLVRSPDIIQVDVNLIFLLEVVH